MGTVTRISHGQTDPRFSALMFGFLLAAARLGVDPASCLVFEDAPAGPEAAARAGLHRIWIPVEHTRRLKPIVAIDAVFEHLEETIEWLEERGVGVRLPLA